MRGLERTHARLPRAGAAVPAIGDALNGGYGYLEVKCLGCNTHQTVALDVVRRPETHPSTIWNATCAARNAPRCGDTLSNAVN